MDMINAIFPFVMLGIFGTMLYSVVRWLMVMASDRTNTDKRKKYARLCLICMLLIAVAMVVGFVITFKRNTM